MDLERALAYVQAAISDQPLVLEKKREGARLSAEGHTVLAHVDFLSPEEGFLHFGYRTTSWEFAGERTDLHDVAPVVLAAILSGVGETSFGFLDEGGFAGPGEIYTRLLLPQQPGPVVDLRQTELLAKRLAAVFFAESLILKALHDPVDCNCEEGRDESPTPAEPNWVSAACGALGLQESPELFLSRRSWPEWQYLHSPRRALTLVECVRLANLLGGIDARQQRTSERVEEGLLVRSGALDHVIPTKTIKRATRTLRKLDDLPEGEEPHLFPLEDRVVASGFRHVLVLPADSGQAAFQTTRVRCEARARRQLDFLGGPSHFEWVESIAPERFEDLIRDLLRTAGLVQRVRQVGAANDRDRGRDLIADWVLPVPAKYGPEEPAYRVVPVIAQAKARSAAVGKSDVPDIVDTLEEHDACGYFLAVSGRLTAPLVDRLEALRRKGRFEVIEWWERPQIEDQLRRAPDVLARYPDLVRPGSA
jgi:Restriction endonuclease